MTERKNSDQSNRRDFISGRASLRAWNELADDAVHDPRQSFSQRAGEQLSETGSCLTQIGRRAMACEFQILWDTEKYGPSTDSALRALDLVDRLESQLSVFRSESEVSQLNHQASQHPVQVENKLYQLLEQCQTLSEQTRGCFDITSSPLSRLWGFHRRKGEIPKSAEIERTLQAVGHQWLVLNASGPTVHFRHPEMEINLGSIGKGYALDCCSDLLEEAEIHDYIVHGGLSSIVARGSRHPQRTDSSGWRVALRHPLKPEKRLAEIRLRDCALGTSGSANQFFYHQGKRLGHILDPRTGQPADGVLSVTVLASTAAVADALATAFFVMGKEEAFRYCEKHPHLAALFVLPGSRQGSIEIHTCGLADNDWICCQPAADDC